MTKATKISVHRASFFLGLTFSFPPEFREFETANQECGSEFVETFANSKAPCLPTHSLNNAWPHL